MNISDRPGLLQPKAVEDIQEVYISALQSYIEIKRPKQQTLFARIVLKLAELRGFTSEQVTSCCVVLFKIVF